VSHSLHSRALSDAHKAEIVLLTARTANEQGQASLRAAGEVLDTSRKHVNETTKMLRKKMDEVDRLRARKMVDDKEHAIKGPLRRVSLLV
jgi:biotin operon repressor